MRAAISIGVDLDESVCSIGLRESNRGHNSVCLAGRWPIHAVEEAAVTPFWQERFRELVAYLGGIPLRAVPVCVSVPSGAHRRIEEHVQRAMRQAGFGPPMLINRVDAVAALWAHVTTTTQLTAITVLHIGGATIERRHMGIRQHGRGIAIEPQDDPVVEQCLANDALIAHLCGMVRDLVPGTLAASEAHALREAAYDFGCYLRELTPGDSRPWSGPLAERLSVPFTVGLEDVAAWPATRSLGRAIERILPASPQQASHDIVLGGIGAPWPVAWHAAYRATKGTSLWLSNNPRDDVALGAALWPLCGTAAEWGETTDAGIPDSLVEQAPTVEAPNGPITQDRQSLRRPPSER